MMSMKRILKLAALYLACVAAIGGVVFFCISFFGQKTFYLDQKQWNPAKPETQHIDLARLNKALDYVDTRLPTARSLLMLRNGKTVVEKYYWFGGPKETDYLHSLNLPLLQVLIGIAIDQQLIQRPEQPLSAFFQKHLSQNRSDDTDALTLGHLLGAQAPLLWGAENPDYWDLFYAADRIGASLRVISRQRTETQPAINFAAAYLLSQVIEQVSGQSVFNFAQHYLFHPLGIRTYGADDDGLPHDPMVGFQLKALDLAKIGLLLSREGAWDGQQIVSREWVRWLFFKAPGAKLADAPGGSWVKTTIKGHESLMVRGDGGQYLVLFPA
ncbi:MAG: serine hydrolase [Desulfobacterales bacterium]